MNFSATEIGNGAKALAAAKGAQAHKLADRWYVVYLSRDGGRAHEFFGASSHAPEATDSKRVAVRYFMVTGGTLLKPTGEPVLTLAEIELLSFARESWADE